jgi:hypothetical protein
MASQGVASTIEREGEYLAEETRDRKKERKKGENDKPRKSGKK